MKKSSKKQVLDLSVFLLKKIKEYPNKHYNAYGELKKILEEAVEDYSKNKNANNKRSNTSSKANSLYPD